MKLQHTKQREVQNDSHPLTTCSLWGPFGFRCLFTSAVPQAAGADHALVRIGRAPVTWRPAAPNSIFSGLNDFDLISAHSSLKRYILLTLKARTRSLFPNHV
ncbi:hypothetical protein CBS63078_8409 [Aspergillus niger]|nr:hypothetical protein CBS133816_10518 [Aspergillus niger]KAI2822605.1 hypothetical protein CBS115989_1996 [Aspergillus niger]KAI2849252.1 hypothetical protein CBS11350_2404 [Aspergillus niger]KAI2851545.1 hypothetical protein CBS12448_8480 [Aspergillus niger]KAI2859882.1 hypothetical protein CBS11232_1811 [Aspergillus niger]